MNAQNLLSDEDTNGPSSAQEERGCCRIEHNGNVTLLEGVTFDECIREADTLAGTPTFTPNTSCEE